jgi:hypothetical protein
MLLKTKKFEDDSPHVNLCKFLLYELWPIWSPSFSSSTVVEGRRWIEHGHHIMHVTICTSFSFYSFACTCIIHSPPSEMTLKSPRQRMGWRSRTSLNLCKLLLQLYLHTCKMNKECEFMYNWKHGQHNTFLHILNAFNSKTGFNWHDHSLVQK